MIEETKSNKMARMVAIPGRKRGLVPRLVEREWLSIIGLGLALVLGILDRRTMRIEEMGRTLVAIMIWIEMELSIRSRRRERIRALVSLMWIILC